MIVAWPGQVAPGTVNSNRVMIEDFFPAILDMAGAGDYSTVQTVDGVSFKDLLLDPSINRDRPTVWHFPNRRDGTVDETQGYGPYSALMKGPYHFIYFWESGNKELYNVAEDISETNNLIATQPAVAAEMASELTRMLKEMDAQRPAFKESGALVPLARRALKISITIPHRLLSPGREKSWRPLLPTHQADDSVLNSGLSQGCRHPPGPQYARPWAAVECPRSLA